MAETKKTAKTASVVKSIDKLRAELAAKRQELLDSRRSHKAGELYPFSDFNPHPCGMRLKILNFHCFIRC